MQGVLAERAVQVAFVEYFLWLLLQPQEPKVMILGHEMVLGQHSSPEQKTQEQQ